MAEVPGWLHGRGIPLVGATAGIGLLVLALFLVADSRSSEPTTQGLPNQATEADVSAHADRFGISYLEPTMPGGTYWVSHWDTPRDFAGVDPEDVWFDANHGSATYSAGDGELRITGETARMYVHDPDLQRQWRDVEVTMYVKRVDDSGIPYSGMTAVARANHLTTEDGAADLCDTRGYGGRLRFDGHADFEKETAHPRNQAFSNKLIFSDGLPVGQWLGYKYLVFDRDDGVHLQLWLDRTGGVSGGSWQLIDEMVDDGHVFGEVPCAPGIDPQMMLTNAPQREGSESGKPNVSVYFRADGIGPDGLVYKWGSIREIAP
jgi:hypothetical protein